MADLCTIADVQTYLHGSDHVLESNEVLATLITASSAWVEAQLGRTFTSRTVTETRDGDGTSRLILKEYPATAVTSVTVDGDTIPARPTVDGEGWVLNGTSALDLVGYSFTSGTQNVVIVYTAGEAVPAPVKQATVEHVAFKYRRRMSIGKGSESAAGESTSYADAGVLAGIQDLLDPYRVLVVT